MGLGRRYAAPVRSTLCFNIARFIVMKNVLFVLLFFSSFCSANEPIYNGNFSCLGSYGAKYGLHQKAYKSALGEPKSIERLGKEFEKYLYDGLEISFYKPSYGTEFALSKVKVTDAKWEVIKDTKIGDKQDKLKELNGKAGKDGVETVCGDADCLEYEIV